MWGLKILLCMVGVSGQILDCQVADIPSGRNIYRNKEDCRKNGLEISDNAIAALKSKGLLPGTKAIIDAVRCEKNDDPQV